MTSYTRKDGKSPYFIKKSVKSIISQSYANWELFVTGDKYEDETEFRSLFASVPQSKLFLYNLPKPGERGNLTGLSLWQSGGVVAMNNAIDRAEKRHKSCESSCNVYITNLDDDDVWSTEHLRELLSVYIRFPSVVFAWTRGYYCTSGGNPYPTLIVPQDKVNNWPRIFGGYILHSSWSWNMKVFRGFRYRGYWDFPPGFTGSKTADHDLFEVVRVHIAAKKLDYYHSSRATIEHLVERGAPCAKNGPLWYPD
ncbi:unnamed protein product [Rotaria magnacalcarata]|nr:unnamed protein product [Rotaria magnacalcarata]